MVEMDQLVFHVLELHGLHQSGLRRRVGGRRPSKPRDTDASGTSRSTSFSHSTLRARAAGSPANSSQASSPAPAIARRAEGGSLRSPIAGRRPPSRPSTRASFPPRTPHARTPAFSQTPALAHRRTGGQHAPDPQADCAAELNASRLGTFRPGVRVLPAPEVARFAI
jgi:hypothetical protein